MRDLPPPPKTPITSSVKRKPKFAYTGIPVGSGLSSSTKRIDAKEPKMGGLTEGCCGKEAWVGGQPNHSWTRLENPRAIDFPQPSQMRSSSAKAATSHLKCTKGIFLEESHGFKTGDDLDNSCARFKTHFKSCLLYTSPSPRDRTRSRMPSSA